MFADPSRLLLFTATCGTVASARCSERWIHVPKYVTAKHLFWGVRKELPVSGGNAGSASHRYWATWVKKGEVFTPQTHTTNSIILYSTSFIGRTSCNPIGKVTLNTPNCVGPWFRRPDPTLPVIIFRSRYNRGSFKAIGWGGPPSVTRRGYGGRYWHGNQENGERFQNTWSTCPFGGDVIAIDHYRRELSVSEGSEIIHSSCFFLGTLIRGLSYSGYSRREVREYGKLWREFWKIWREFRKIWQESESSDGNSESSKGILKTSSRALTSLAIRTVGAIAAFETQARLVVMFVTVTGMVTKSPHRE